MAAYTWFTVSTTAWRTQFRRDANRADNRAADVSVDALINIEAVKVSFLSATNMNPHERLSNLTT